MVSSTTAAIATSGGSNQDQPIKPKKHKSRNGCLTCKKKRLKCDETKPFCVNCTKKKIQCGGYAIAFKWKSFKSSGDTNIFKCGETSFSSAGTKFQSSNYVEGSSASASSASTSYNDQDSEKIPGGSSVNASHATAGSKSGLNETVLQKHLEAASLSMTGKNLEQIKLANDLILQGKNPDYAENLKSRQTSPNHVRSRSIDVNSEHSFTQRNRLSSVGTGVSPHDIVDQVRYLKKENHSHSSCAILDDNNQDGDIKDNTNSIPSKPISPSEILNRSNPESTGSRSNNIVNDNSNSSNNNNDSSSESPLSDDQGQEHSSDHENNSNGDGLSANHLPVPLEETVTSIDYSNLNSLANLASQVKHSTNNFSQFSIPSPNFYNFFNSLSPASANNIERDFKNIDHASPSFSPSLTALTSSIHFKDLMNQIKSPKPSLTLSEIRPSSTESNYLSNSTPPSMFSETGSITANTPTLSTLINAFTDFENVEGMSAPSPFDLKDRNHNQTEGDDQNKVQGEDDEYERQSLDENNDTQLVSFQSNSGSRPQAFDMQAANSMNFKFAGSGAHSLNQSKPKFKVSIPIDIPLSEQEKIFESFDTYTSGIMSIKSGPDENPWRYFILPLAQKYPVVYYSIASMTCFHVARGNNEVRALGLKNMKLAIVELAKELGTNNLPPAVALVTCLALATSECWDRHISSGVTHLRGARSMILKVLQSFANSNTHGDGRRGQALPKELQFLCNAWVYFDVLSRMTCDPNPEENIFGCDPFQNGQSNYDSDFVASSDGGDNNHDNTLKKRKLNDTTQKPSSSTNSSSSTSPRNTGKQQKQPFANLIKQFEHNIQSEEVDPLLGCAQSLFPIMGKVASLISQVRKNSRQDITTDFKKNSLSVISKAVELRKKLTEWRPTSSMKMAQGEDSSWDLSSCVATAEAYRYATLLYLHQAVPEIPSLSSHQIAEKVLLLLASIPTSSRTCVIHIFPLLIASCEATPGEERDWCLERWQVLSHMMGIGNIDRAVEVVKEVWSRKNVLQSRRKSRSGSTASCGRGEDEKNPGGQMSDIVMQISGLMAAINGDKNYNEDLEEGRIQGWAHWTTVMKDWGWEVLLG